MWQFYCRRKFKHLNFWLNKFHMCFDFIKWNMELCKEETNNKNEKSQERENKTDTLNGLPPVKRFKFHNKQTQNTKPRKRISIVESSISATKRNKFLYGNYSQYYGYRNMDTSSHFHDVRIEVFQKYQDVFCNKDILDIGCNCGLVTIEVAKRFNIKSIIGLDIDRNLIQQAIKAKNRENRLLNFQNKNKNVKQFPFNVAFVHGNYVLKNDILLEIERPQFDVILCLSLTKWIHLHFGDDGLKQAFRRMYLQLKPGGALILEAQPFKNYAKRKRLTEGTLENYKNMCFLPEDFNKYLLSRDVGFINAQLMAVPDHCKNGFKRPIYIFYKG